MRILLALAVAMPSFAFAAGSDMSSPPKTTKTTSECKGTQVWDDKTQSCVDPKESSLDTDTLYGAVRELAYAVTPTHRRFWPRCPTSRTTVF